MDPTIMVAPPSLDSRFAAHAAISAVLLGLPGTFSFLADVISVPLNSLEKVYERKYTRRPAENACIINFYETLVQQDLDMEGIITELDADGDGTIGEWELKAAMNDLSIPSFQHNMIIDLLLDNSQHRVSVSSFMDNLQELYFDINEFKQSKVPSLRSIAEENELQTTLTFVSLFDFACLSCTLLILLCTRAHSKNLCRGRSSRNWTRMGAVMSRSRNSME